MRIQRKRPLLQIPQGLISLSVFSLFFFWWPMCNFKEVREANKLYDAGFDLHTFGPVQASSD